MPNLRLAEQLGAETVTLTGQDVAEEIVAYARTRNVTKIIVGKPAQARWRELLFGDLVHDLVHRSGDIDVYVIRGEEGLAPRRVHGGTAVTRRRLGDYGLAVLATALCTALNAVMPSYFDLSALIMVYLLAR